MAEIVKDKSIPPYIISDAPEKRAERFGFKAYAETLSDLIANKRNKTPLVIGIYGPWGSGKTTLMEAIKSNLEQYKGDGLFRSCKSVWFQAWKYKEEEEILAALVEEIFKAMEQESFFKRFEAKIEKLSKRLDAGKVWSTISKFITFGKLDVSEFFKELEYRNKLGFYETFQRFFDDLIRLYITGKSEESKVDDSQGVLVIFIDDLDRCPRPKILKVLETVKLFMDKEGCVFVIGAASDIIEKAIEEVYREDAHKFMDKIVQVTFNLPRIDDREIMDFIGKWAEGEISEEFKGVLASCLDYNPRRVKRFLNNLSLQESLASGKGLLTPGNLEEKHLIQWNIAEYVYPTFTKWIKDNPRIIESVKEHIERIEKEVPEDALRRWNIPDEVIEKAPHPIQEYLRKESFYFLIREFPSDPELIRTLSTLTTATETKEEVRAKEKSAEKITFDKMVRIPKGRFLMGDEDREEIIEYDYQMDVYPVTNDQCRKFVEQGGYENKQYWSDAGWNWKEQKKSPIQHTGLMRSGTSQIILW